VPVPAITDLAAGAEDGRVERYVEMPMHANPTPTLRWAGAWTLGLPSSLAPNGAARTTRYAGTAATEVYEGGLTVAW
jgi:hypothetical protein